MTTTWRQRWDGFTNVLTGLGGARDKRTATTYQRGVALGDEVCDSLYHGNDLAGLICDTFPEEALRQGFTLELSEDDSQSDPESEDYSASPARKDATPDPKPEGQDLSEQVHARMEELQVAAMAQDAAIWGNVYGAAAVMLGVDDGRNVSLPLDPQRVKRLKYLHVIDKRDLKIQTYYADPLKPNFGTPELYTFVNAFSSKGGAPITAQGTNILIHESRLVFFYGSRTSKRRQLDNGGWPYSKLQKPYETIRDFDMSWQGASYLLSEASQAVYGVKGLLEIISSNGGSKALQKRMEIIDMGRSVARSLVIDAEGETFERKPTSFAGVPDLLDRFCNRLSAATRIPVAILMGQSPAGLNATGASDIRMFYDRVKSYQTDTIRPAVEKILRLIILELTQGKEPENWKVCFPSLYQMTDAEKADVMVKVAGTDKIYEEMGALSPEEIATNRFRKTGWSMETTIDLELRKELGDLEKDNMLDRKKNPPDLQPPEPVPGKPGVPAAKPKAKE